ncbi:MAG: acyl-CoA dehydrogenase family protein [Reyranella sp.]|nr:acyl-CoA dehydrogenase family protein [Reyranella sp.]
MTLLEVQARAAVLRPLLAANADATSAQRFVHTDNIRSLRDAGLFRMCQSRRLGGMELPLRAMHLAVNELALACPSTAWVLMVLSAHTWMLGMFPEACQDEVANDDADTLISGTLAANGSARRVDGGWRLSGRWQFASGCDHARWNLIGARVEGGRAAGFPAQIHMIAPTADYRIEDTWFTLGLRGTGSKDLVLQDVLVPDHRAISTGVLFSGGSEWARRHPTWLHMTPVAVGLGYHVSAAVLGIARSALAAFIERTSERDDKYTGTRKADSVGIQLRVARAQADITAAALLLDSIADRFDALSESRALPDIPTRAEMRMIVARAVGLCREAIERLFAAAGANAIYETSSLQALFRDLSVGTHHAMVDEDSAAETFGRVLLGLSPGSTIL